MHLEATPDCRRGFGSDGVIVGGVHGPTSETSFKSDAGCLLDPPAAHGGWSGGGER